MKLKPLPLSKVYGLLEPGPVVMLTTAWKGKMNVMTLSWHTMMDFEPPLIGCVVGAGDYSFEALKESGECVIAIPTLEMARIAVKVGNCSGRDTDKFSKFGILTLPAFNVRAPLLAGCFANIECKVVDQGWAEKYNFFVLKGLQAWVNTAYRKPQTLHHKGNGLFMASGKTFKLPSRMR